MSTPARLLAFGVAAILSFGGGAALGAVAGPSPEPTGPADPARPAPATPHTGHGDDPAPAATAGER